MFIRKMLWVLGISLAVTGGASAQTPGVVPAAPAVPACCPAPATPAPATVTVCVKTRGTKTCCAWNRLLEKLCIHDHTYVKIQRPAPRPGLPGPLRGGVCPGLPHALRPGVRQVRPPLRA